MKNRTTPENVKSLANNEIFVFGSNEDGIHGAGAAKLATSKFGALWGYGFGLRGKTFAIPTKDWDIDTLALEDIQFYVKRFIAYVKMKNIEQPGFKYLVTEIGCGLAGYTPEEIAPMFKDAVNLENVYLPKRFWNILNKTN